MEGFGCDNQNKKSETPHGFPFFVCLSCRRRLLQGFRCEAQPIEGPQEPHGYLSFSSVSHAPSLSLWLCPPSRRRRLEVAGREDQLNKKLKTPHGFHVFFWGSH